MLQLTDVTYKYKLSDSPALEGVSFSIESGARLGLLGVNGAGKSTLVSLLMGLQCPSSGHVNIDGCPAVLGRTDVGYVPQDYAFYEQLSIAQNLTYFAAVLYRENKQQALSAIDRVIDDCQLSPILHRRAEQCSGGEKRRLNLAIALLRVPRLLILDEPTANVDPHARAKIISIVRALNEQGVTIVYTSHLLSEVQSLCDQLVFIHQGKRVCFGSAQSLLSSNAVSLNIRAPSLNEDHIRLLNQQLNNAVEKIDQGCSIALPQLSCSQVDALQKIEALGLDIETINSTTESLEDVFFAVTKDQSKIDECALDV